MTWFYESNGAQKGPISEGELDRLIADGTILPATLVWHEGMASWTPLQQVRRETEATPPRLGTVQCDSCQRLFDPTDVIEISGRKICAECKPAVLQSLQQGGTLPYLSDPQRTEPAWEQKEALGWFAALQATVKSVLMEPSQTFANMRCVGGLTNPLWFHVITGGTGSAALSLYMGLAQMFLIPALQPNKPAVVGTAMLLTLAFQVVWAFVGAAMTPFISGGIQHLCLMLCGGAKRPFETTFRVISYGGGSVAVLHLVPVLGTIVAIPWSLVVNCIGLAKAHETDLWRAVLAVFLPGIVCCGGMVVIILAVFGTMGATNGFGG